MSWLKAKDWATGVEYSTLFHSGLRAISSRKPRDLRHWTYSPSSSAQESDSSGRMCLATPLPPSLFRQRTPPSPSMSTSTESSSASQPCTPKVVCRLHQPTMYVGPKKEAAHAWASEEKFFDMGKYPLFPEEEGSYRVPPIDIDGVRPLPFFMNMKMGEMEEVAIGEDSILLLSSSPDMFPHHLDPQCECPIPMRMSPPPRRVRGTRRNRGDRTWMLEGSSPELKTHGLEEEIQLDEEPEDMADWREFHVDLLATIR